MTWIAAALGVLLGPFLIMGADRWCPHPASGRLRVIGGAVLAVCLAALAARLIDPVGTPMMPSSADHVWAAGVTWVGFAVLAGFGVVLGRIDLTVLRLPDVLVLPAYPLVGLPLAVAHPAFMTRALVAAGTCLLGYGLLCVFGGLGFGDVKLGGLLGLALGYLSWSAVAIGVLTGLALGAGHAVARMAAGRANRKSPVPFGPAMLVGALVATLIAS